MTPLFITSILQFIRRNVEWWIVLGIVILIALIIFILVTSVINGYGGYVLGFLALILFAMVLDI